MQPGDTGELVKLARAARVKQAATESGFDAVGIAAATPADRFDAYLAARDAGYFADLAWLARDDAVAKRRDPQLLLPGARALVMVAASYGRPEAPVTARTARIARYAVGDDYHEVLLPRLDAMVARLADLGGRWRAYVDTGPVLEVARAAQAGLGWVGKHGLLLRRNGSWFLLGTLLTTLELEPDEAGPDRCGTCTRCLDACPTEAIVAPRVVDARRCLAYLTIERKGSIPRELRPGVGPWIFGCDICQEVCPWNRRFSKPGNEPAFAPRPELEPLDLLALLALDEEAFRQRFRGSPLWRAKRRGLLRNVCVVLGNLGERAAVPALATRLQDPEPLIRGHAAWALGRLGGEAAVAALAGALPAETDREVRDELAAALREAGM